ncbi:MAG TPA: HAD family hydrolase [Acidimicrobiales bacterium]
MIKAVLFDGDQTLWDFERVMRDALIAVAAELRAARPGAFTDALSWRELEQDRAAVGEEWDGIEYNLARLRVLGFARTLERLRAAEGGDAGADVSGDEALTLELSDSYFAHRDRDPALFADTVSGLEVLRGRYRLGLLSNGSRLPEAVGLGGVFECVVFAQDHRVAKPDKGIFEIVERQLGLDPDECVLVGDHLLNDVAGAKRAGWSAVWIDRDGIGEGDGFEVRPDAVVGSLHELHAVLAALDDVRPA